MVKATCFYKTICCIFLFTFMGLSVLADGVKAKTNQPNRMDSSFSGIERFVKKSQNEIIEKINDLNKKIDERIDENFDVLNKKFDAAGKDNAAGRNVDVSSLIVSIVAVLLFVCSFVCCFFAWKNKYKAENIKPFFDEFNKNIPVLKRCDAIKNDLDDKAKDITKLDTSVSEMNEVLKKIKNKEYKMSEDDILKIKEIVAGRLDVEAKITPFGGTKNDLENVLKEITKLDVKMNGFEKQLLDQSRLDAVRTDLLKKENELKRERSAFENDKKEFQKEKVALNDSIRLAVEKEKANWGQSLKKERDENNERVRGLNADIRRLNNEKEVFINERETLKENFSTKIAEARQEEAKKNQEEIKNLQHANGTLEERLRNVQEEATKEKNRELLAQEKMLREQYNKKYEGEILQLKSNLEKKEKLSSMM